MGSANETCNFFERVISMLNELCKDMPEHQE